MKAMTTGEKHGLIRHHANILLNVGHAALCNTPSREQIIETAQRIVEIATSLPNGAVLPTDHAAQDDLP